MKKTVILLALSVLTIGAANAEAYFRSNTTAAKESRLRDRELSLEKKILSSRDSSEKAELQSEIQETISEMKQLKDKKEATANNK